MRRLFTALVITSCLACQQQSIEARSPSPTPSAQGSRLLQEKSPYLRQHADNAVDWYPWGEEAFTKARQEKKPIFLSVGYSTCHWCHVMERESFMNAEVGEYLNTHFVPIKVDRETRPDVDRLYMTYVTASTGSGGWPMSVFLTPDKEPFFGGTYYPQPARYGRPSFLEVLTQVHEVWVKDSAKVTQQAQKIKERLAASARGSKDSKMPKSQLVDMAVTRWRGAFDGKRGGFGQAPKFPQPAMLDLLLRYGRSHPKSGAEKMVFKTLEAMALGGIRDHLEGGFHRYSTDGNWLVPHFEKMLYDQALLVQVYSDAYAWTGDELYREAAESTLDYLLSRMTHSEGGFFSAEDADSTIPGTEHEHAEGAFYVWTEDEVKNLLTAPELEKAIGTFGIESKGNAGEDPSGELKGKNVLHLKTRVKAEALEAIKVKLRQARDTRPRPARDDKILTAWNGMAVAAFARAGRQLNRPDYIEVAEKAMTFLEASLKTTKGWKRSFLEGSAEVDAFAVDYAELIAANLELYQTTGKPGYFQRAAELQAEQDELFWDQEFGGYFETRADSELIYRDKEKHDGATWSANSRSAVNLIALHRLSGENRYRDRAEKLLVSIGSDLSKQATSMAGMLSAVELWYGSNESVVIVGDQPDWWRTVGQGYHPGRSALWLKNAAWTQELAPLARHVEELPNKPAAYICRDFACGLPLTTLADLKKKLGI